MGLLQLRPIPRHDRFGVPKSVTSEGGNRDWQLPCELSWITLRTTILRWQIVLMERIRRMRPSTIRIVNWNIEWRRGSNRHGTELRARITSLDPDIVCITEGHTEFLEHDYHPIFSDEDYGYPIRQGRRKVALWSKKPWREIDAVGSADMPPGRFISGITDSAVGPLQCVGVCIPWSHAHVTSGRKDAKVWEEHLSYLEGLARYLRGIENRRLIVLGDFNQMIPRTRAPKKAYEKLMDVLPSQLSIETTGSIPDVDKQTLDHIAISSDLSGSGLTGLSNYWPTGERLSDHFGISLSIGAAT